MSGSHLCCACGLLPARTAACAGWWWDWKSRRPAGPGEHGRWPFWSPLLSHSTVRKPEWKAEVIKTEEGLKTPKVEVFPLIKHYSQYCVEANLAVVYSLLYGPSEPCSPRQSQSLHIYHWGIAICRKYQQEQMWQHIARVRHQRRGWLQWHFVLTCAED